MFSVSCPFLISAPLTINVLGVVPLVPRPVGHLGHLPALRPQALRQGHAEGHAAPGASVRGAGVVRGVLGHLRGAERRPSEVFSYFDPVLRGPERAGRPPGLREHVSELLDVRDALRVGLLRGRLVVQDERGLRFI